MMKGFLIILTLLTLASCQVKEKTAGGGLISGHLPTQNAFTIQPPAQDILTSGDVFTVKLDFPFDVAVTDSPRLALTVGAATRYATYVSGTGTGELTFAYTIAPGENDTDGITVTALELNGGTLTFDDHGTTVDCAVATVPVTTFPGTIVDNAAPTVSAFDMTSLPSFYNVGEVLSFSVTYNETVVVTGAPSFSVTFGTGGAKPFVYASGSGTNTLSFTYTVQNTVADNDAYDAITSPIALNGGTIKDTGGNNASLDFSAYAGAVRTGKTPLRPVDGRVPFIVSVTPPANGTYEAAQALDFVVNFNENVNVTGSHYLSVGIGSNIRQAAFVSRTNNTALFRYVTVPGDVDADGITLPAISPALTPVIVASSGDITSVATTRSFYTPTTNNTFTAPTMTGVLVTSIQPQPMSVSRNTDTTFQYGTGSTVDNVWNIGQELLITVTFNTPVYVTQTNGVPTLQMTFNGVAKEATYLSGGNGQTNLVFRYIVLEGDTNPATSVAIGNLKLNGGVITDTASTNSLLTFPTAQTLPNTSIDGIRPVISSVTAPANGSYSTVDSTVNNTAMRWRMVWSESVRYDSLATDMSYFNMSVGDVAPFTTLKLNIESGSTNPATTFYHIPPALTGLNDTNGVTVGSPLTLGTTVKDSAGNDATVLTFTPPTSPLVKVDTTAPTVTSVTAPANKTYILGEVITFSVLFNEPVAINNSGTNPSISLTLDSGAVLLRPTNAGLATTHTFSYTVTAPNLDVDGVTLANTIARTTAGYVRDAGHNLVTGTYPLPTTTGVQVDGVVPATPTAVASASGSFDSGDVLTITLTYDDDVVATGTPTIDVFADSDPVTPMSFSLLSGSGTPTHVYRKTLTATDIDFTGLPTSVSSITGGTLKDGNGNTVTNSFAAVNLSNHYLVYPNTALWIDAYYTNRGLPGNPTASNSGSGTPSMCASGMNVCQDFDGDDTVTLSSNLNNVTTVFLVLTMPTTLSTISNFLGNDLGLDYNTPTFDFDTSSSNAAIIANGVSTSGTTNHDVNMNPGETYVVQVVFNTAQNYSGAAMRNVFRGQLGEMMMINGSLTNAQRSVIRNYLEAKY